MRFPSPLSLLQSRIPSLSLRLSKGNERLLDVFSLSLSPGSVGLLLLLSWVIAPTLRTLAVLHDSLDLRARVHRVIFDEDTKIPNAATLTINKEDHTLANMLRSCVRLCPPRPMIYSSLAEQR